LFYPLDGLIQPAVFPA